MTDTERAAPSLRCRLGLHRWQRVSFPRLSWVFGRRCRRCGRTQHYWPRLIGSSWRDTDLVPNRDAHGYY